jgi:hypothetical protein
VLHLPLALLFFGFELERYQLGQQMKQVETIFGKIRRIRIKCTQGAEIATVLPVQRYGDIALDTENPQSRVITKTRISAGLVDEEWYDRTTNNASVRGV